MKKLWNSPIFLQMLCVILVMFLTDSFITNRAHEDLLTESLSKDMPKIIKALQQNNATLLGFSMLEAPEEEINLEVMPFTEMMFIDRELEKVLGVQHYPFNWFHLEMIEWNIRDISRQTAFSEADKAYIKQVRTVNQALIDAYYDIIEEKGVDFRIRYDDKDQVISIYKAFVKRANQIAQSQAYQEVKAFEIIEEEATVQSASTDQLDVVEIDQEDAKKMALDFIETVTGETPVLTMEISAVDYEFEPESEKPFEENIYNVSVEKDGSALSAYLTCYGDGNYSEAKIDEAAEKYRVLLIPKEYVLYNRRVSMTEKAVDEIQYEFIYFENDCYDLQRKIAIGINNRGQLSEYDSTFNLVPLKITGVVERDQVTKQLKDETLAQLIMVRTKEDTLEYWAYVKSNERLYTVIFDAKTGDKKSVLPDEEVYYMRPSL